MEIQLTQGKVTLVDAEDYETLAAYKWCVANGYAVRGVWAGGRKSFRMHREIMNPPNGYYVDHINGDKLDNRRCNLRVATAKQNSCNQRHHRDNKSGYKGVSLHRPSGRFVVHIKVSGKGKCLGYFTTKEEAASAYDRAAVEYYGEFARLNFPAPGVEEFKST